MSVKSTSINYFSVAAVPWNKWETGANIEILGYYTGQENS